MGLILTKQRGRDGVWDIVGGKAVGGLGVGGRWMSAKGTEDG